MPGDSAHFTPEEIQEVLSHYDIGNIIQIKTLNAGNANAPKKIVLSDRGRFLLKRRAKDKSDIYHVAFSHTIQNHLQTKNFPVAGFLRTRRTNNTAVHHANNTYELFNFVAGSRYDGSKQGAVNSGKQLALFHKHLADFLTKFDPLRRTYHDSSSVRGYLKTITSSKPEGWRYLVSFGPRNPTRTLLGRYFRFIRIFEVIPSGRRQFLGMRL